MPFKYPNTPGAVAQLLDFKLYIQGVELTQLVENFSVTHNLDSGGADITFKDSNNALTLTSDNVHRDIWNISPGHEQFSESPKKEIYEWKVLHNTEGPNGKLNFENLRRWPLGPDRPILHRMDTIRIFAKVPWLSENEKNSWIPLFNGYVTSISRSRSRGAQPTSTLSITCQNLKYVLAKSRLAQNPIVQSYGKLGDTVVDNAGLFRDVVLPKNQLTNVLYNRQPEDIISFLIFGRYYTPDDDTKTGQISAIGNFKHTKDHQRFLVDKADSVKIGDIHSFQLEDWHNGCIYGSDVNGGNRILPLTLSEVETQGKGSAFNDTYCAHGTNMAVRFLKPEEGFGYTTLVSQTINNLDQYEADWVTRLDLLDNILTPLYYKFWISGSGDLIFEYPMVDFKPADYGDYSKLLSIVNYESDNYSETDVPLPTLITVNGGNPSNNIDDVGQTGNRYFRVDLVFPALAARLGVTHETLSFPYTYNGDQLVLFGLATLQQRISELETYSLSGVPWLLGLSPNRPIEVPDLNALLSVMSITYSFSSSGQGFSMDIDLDFPRLRSEDGIYRTIFGTESNPLSYVTLFDQSYTFEPPTIGTAGKTAKVFYVVSTSVDTKLPPAADTTEIHIETPVGDANNEATVAKNAIETSGGENKIAEQQNTG